MSSTKYGLKVAAVCFFYVASLLGVYVYTITYGPKPKCKCKPCKCECKEKKAKKPREKPRLKPRARASGEFKKVNTTKSVIEREAATLFLSWLEDCKKQSKHVHVNLLACIRWKKLHKYLKADYADEAMIARRKIGHLIFDRLGRDLCTRKAEKSKNRYFVTKELSAVYSNARENIRHLKRLKRHHPSLKIPQMKMCLFKKGKLVWDLP